MQVKNASVPSVSRDVSAVPSVHREPSVSSSSNPTREVDPSTRAGVEVSLSKAGSLFSQAAALAEKNPVQFKSMMQLVADDLQAAAGSSGTGASYGQLAARFAAAAQSGKVSELFASESPASAGARPSRAGAPSSAAAAAAGNGARAQGVFGVAANMLEKALTAAEATASSSRGKSST